MKNSTKPITDWNDNAITEQQWVSAIKTAGIFDRSQMAINATKHPWPNEAIFSIGGLSDNFKYWAGLVATDGSISNDVISLILADKDRQILNDLARWSSTVPRRVRQFGDMAHPMARLNFGGGHVIRMMRDLLRVDTTNKTRSLRPRHFLLTDPHFLRGVIDGDGSVCPAGTGGKSSHMINITSAAEIGFLSPLLSHLKSQFNIDCGFYGQSGNSPITKVAQFWGSNAVALARHCYGPTFGNPQQLTLGRKADNAKAIINMVSKRHCPVWMVRGETRKLYLDYISAATDLFIAHGGLNTNLDEAAKTAKIHSLSQSISGLYTKDGKFGQKVLDASFAVPSVKEVSQMLGLREADVRAYNPDLITDLEWRAQMRPEVNYDLSPLIIRKSGSLDQQLFLNCADAINHPILRQAGCKRYHVQNLKKRLKNTIPKEWIGWKPRKAANPLEVRLPTVKETLAEIESRDLDCDVDRVRNILIEKGYPLD